MRYTQTLFLFTLSSFIIGCIPQGEKIVGTSTGLSQPAKPSGENSNDTTAPAAPSSLSYNNLQSTSVQVQWLASLDNSGGSGLKHYKIFLNNSFVQTTTNLFVAFNGLTPNTNYTIGVSAVDQSNNESAVSSLSVKTLAPPATTIDTTAPAAPSSLSYNNLQSTSVQVQWLASLDNSGGSGLKHYKIFLNNSFVQSTTNLFVTFNGLTPNTNYTIGVSAVDQSNNESAVSSLSVKTLAPPQTTLPSGTYTSTSTFVNLPINPAKTSSFEFQFTATPSSTNIDGLVGVTGSAAAAYGDISAIARFSPSGIIDAYNSNSYSSQNSLSYVGNKAYHFKITVNVAAKTYSVKVRPEDGSELIIGENLGFRSTRANTSSFENIVLIATTGTIQLTNLSFQDVTLSPPTPPVTTPQVLNPVTETALTEALKLSSIRYYKNSSGTRISNAAFTGFSAVTKALASYAGNTSADSANLAQIRTSIGGGSEPFSAGGYYAQHERLLTTTIILIKNTPRLWSQLTSDEIQKVNLIMKAQLIASAFTTSDNSEYIRTNGTQRGLDGDTNLNRGWNPNYREGMIGGVLAGVAYFGGPSQADAILNSYNHNSFVSELLAANLLNLHETFTTKARDSSSLAPSGSIIESSVKNYKLYGNTLSNYKAIYLYLTNDTFSKNINCGLNNGAGINGAGRIASGCAQLPNLGSLGMLKEFDSSDANGKRSSSHYAYHGFRPNQCNQLALIAAGLFDKNDTEIKGAMSRMNIGVKDLIYKLQQGYYDYSKGVGSTSPSNMTSTPDMGYRYTFPVWTDVLAPFHGLN